MKTAVKARSNTAARDESPTTIVTFTKFGRTKQHVVERFLTTNGLASRPTDGLIWRHVTEVDVERAVRGLPVRLIVLVRQLDYLSDVTNKHGIGLFREVT